MPAKSHYGRLADEIEGLSKISPHATHIGHLCVKMASNVGLILEALRAADARYDDGK